MSTLATEPIDKLIHSPLENYSTSPSANLFFLVGRGRSGTTLLQSILDSHPNLSVAPECIFIMNLFGRYRKCKWNRNIAIRFYDDLWLERLLDDWDLDKERLREDILSLREDSGFSDLCKIVYRNYARVQKKTHVVNHGDINHHYCLFIEELNAIFPDSKFIHIVRDFRANILSYKNVDFDTNNTSALAFRWNYYNNEVLKCKRFLKDRMFLLKYEDLVTKPLETLEGLCSFLGVDFHQQLLEHHKQERFTFNHPWNPNLRKPINKDRLNAWKKEMSTSDRLRAELVCRKTAELLGYVVPKNRGSHLLYLITLPGMFYGWILTRLEKILFYLPLGLRSNLITFYRIATGGLEKSRRT